MATATPSRVSTPTHRAAGARRVMSRAAFQHTLDSAKRTILLREIALLAIDSFRLNKVRFALTALGMVIGSASLILVVTIGLTGKQYVQRLIQAIGANMIYVEYLGGSQRITASVPDPLTVDDMKAVQETVSAITYASPLAVLSERIA